MWFLAGTIGAGVLAGGINAYYTHKVNQQALAYQRGVQNEVARFWNDYYRNTGFRPRYPYREGSVYDVSKLYRLSAQNTMSVVRAFQPLGGIGGFYRPSAEYKPDKGYYDYVMYG